MALVAPYCWRSKYLLLENEDMSNAFYQKQLPQPPKICILRKTVIFLTIYTVLVVMRNWKICKNVKNFGNSLEGKPCQCT